MRMKQIKGYWFLFYQFNVFLILLFKFKWSLKTSTNLLFLNEQSISSWLKEETNLRYHSLLMVKKRISSKNCCCIMHWFNKMKENKKLHLLLFSGKNKILKKLQFVQTKMNSSLLLLIILNQLRQEELILSHRSWMQIADH